MDIDGQIIDWHQSRGGAGHRAAGHALRILREVVELCIASGAQVYELEDALYAEVAKALDRKEFMKTHTPAEVLEEFVDVRMLMTVFKRYFIIPRDLEAMEWSKLEVCRKRQWQPDADGVLWRPGTRPAVQPRDTAESS